MVDDLPAPFGPQETERLAAVQVEIDAGHRHRSPEALGQAAGMYQHVGSGHPVTLPGRPDTFEWILGSGAGKGQYGQGLVFSRFRQLASGSGYPLIITSACPEGIRGRKAAR
jgi:hypothetical protein